MKHLLPLLVLMVAVGGGCSTPSSVERELDLSDRGFTMIPSDIFSQVELERLDLSDNELSGAP